MTFWILLVLAGWMSYLSLRHTHVLLSLGASIFWLTLMGYNLTFPPTNIVIGSTLHGWMTMGFAVVAIAVMFIWFRNKGRTETTTRVGLDDKGVIATTSTRVGVTGKSLLEQSPEEYRDAIRKSLRTGRRKR
ncbi:hypothetical protein LCGC14_0341290 [marine sediment metagenome]|uniref:Uncharacterized protein n=1 Tax=marine sediment metagenome TaxID=412755 RepID=A0A0F9TWP9_9ZZZZ